MRLTFRQSGGYAGLSRCCELDSEELSAEERDALASLLDQAEHREAAAPPSRARDALAYEIRVEGEGISRTFFLDQANTPDTVEPLIVRCMREAGPRPLRE